MSDIYNKATNEDLYEIDYPFNSNQPSQSASTSRQTYNNQAFCEVDREPPALSQTYGKHIDFGLRSNVHLHYLVDYSISGGQSKPEMCCNDAALFLRSFLWQGNTVFVSVFAASLLFCEWQQMVFVTRLRSAKTCFRKQLLKPGIEPK